MVPLFPTAEDAHSAEHVWILKKLSGQDPLIAAGPGILIDYDKTNGIYIIKTAPQPKTQTVVLKACREDDSEVYVEVNCTAIYKLPADNPATPTILNSKVPDGTQQLL